jgi:anti-anti-sigma factor
VDFAKLDYISSAGLGVLLAAQKELSARGQGLRIINMNGHIRDVFRLSGFDQIFDIA